MTIREAIDRLDARIANTFTNADKIVWLSTAESIVCTTVFNNGSMSYEDVDIDTTLLVPKPFDEMYLYYLEAMIHYYNGENDRYNTAITMYNKFLEDFAAWNNRANVPHKGHNRFVF